MHKSFGAFPVKYVVVPNTHETDNSGPKIAFVNRNMSEIGTLKPLNFRQPKFEDNSTSDFVNYSNQGRSCIVHKAGLILICGGTASILIGIVVARTSNDRGNNGIPSGQGAVGLEIALAGFVAAIIGVPILIGGSIHDHYKGRYSLIAPKSDQI